MNNMKKYIRYVIIALALTMGSAVFARPLNPTEKVQLTNALYGISNDAMEYSINYAYTPTAVMYYYAKSFALDDAAHGTAYSYTTEGLAGIYAGARDLCVGYANATGDPMLRAQWLGMAEGYNAAYFFTLTF